MNLQRTKSRPRRRGAYLRPLDDAEAKWLSNAMFEDARLDNCAWLVRYSTPGEPSAILIEAARAEWVDPASALPALANLIRRFLAALRPLERTILTWAGHLARRRRDFAPPALLRGRRGVDQRGKGHLAALHGQGAAALRGRR